MLSAMVSAPVASERNRPSCRAVIRREGLFSVLAACLLGQPPINAVEAPGVLFATLLPFRLRRKRPPLNELVSPAQTHGASDLGIVESLLYALLRTRSGLTFTLEYLHG